METKKNGSRVLQGKKVKGQKTFRGVRSSSLQTNKLKIKHNKQKL